MAVAVTGVWGESVAGRVIVPDGYGADAGAIEVVEASHPVPDGRGQAATASLVGLIENAPQDTQVLGLWSGGASALLVSPVDGLSLQEKQIVSKRLLACGAPISALNTVRKHLSNVKGGKFAVFARAKRMTNLIVSDVVGDDLSVIGSGPTAPDPTTSSDALDVLDRYGIDLPSAVRRRLEAGEYETPKTLPEWIINTLVLRPADLLEAVVKRAVRAGCSVTNLGDAIEGEAVAAARDLGARAIALARESTEQPILLVSGGEVTVTHSGTGVGGPNLEFALGFADAVKGHPRIWAFAADTDGSDGVSGVAGAIVTPDVLSKAKSAGMDAGACLESHNSKCFFEATGDLFSPGPTGSNLNDLRLVLILPD